MMWKRCGKAIRLGLRAAVAIVLLAVSASARVEASPPRLDWAIAVLPSGAEFSLEIARSDEERARGYMFREKIGEREGMLFLFEKAGRHGFWMKNCLVSLDIVWLDERLDVVHIARDVPPCPEQGECRSVEPLRSGRYVLEFAAGTTRAQGLEVGDRVVVLSQPELP